MLYKADLEQNQASAAHSAATTIALVHAHGLTPLDPEGRYEIGQEVIRSMRSSSRTAAKYPERLKEALENTERPMRSSSWVAPSRVSTWVAACFEFDFMGGSMGSVVGERFVAGVKPPSSRKCLSSVLPLPAVRVCRKACCHSCRWPTNAALTRLAKKGLPYISVLTDPTMGGVSAGFTFVATS